MFYAVNFEKLKFGDIQTPEYVACVGKAELSRKGLIKLSASDIAKMSYVSY